MENRNLDWELSATCGMMGRDIDFDFLAGLSQIELINFGMHLETVKGMYDDEIDSRVV